MTKDEIVNEIAENAEITKVAAQEALNSFINSVKQTLRKGGKVTLVGFGTFSVSNRKARMGRNPQTGETIKIKARKAPKFSAGQGLKDAVK